MRAAIRLAVSLSCLLCGPALALAADSEARSRASKSASPEVVTPEGRESAPFIAGTWRYPSGSTVVVWEYLDQFAEGDEDSSAFIGRYVRPAEDVASGGATPGMFSLVGFRTGRRIQGKLWLFTVNNLHCYPDGQSRSFTGEISPDGSAFTISFRKVVLTDRDCAIADRPTAEMTAERLPANAAVVRAAPQLHLE
ncbi:MAG: hypothetical protein QNJ94_03020 [Alphaproteobacteria bacterium]|nr:hypothetical protein [Alphaproteobacteria bacterium]